MCNTMATVPNVEMTDENEGANTPKTPGKTAGTRTDATETSARGRDDGKETVESAFEGIAIEQISANNKDLKDTKITTAASMRALWSAVWQGNAATLEELWIQGYEVSEQCISLISLHPNTLKFTC